MLGIEIKELNKEYGPLLKENKQNFNFISTPPTIAGKAHSKMRRVISESTAQPERRQRSKLGTSQRRALAA
jgi:hypothetical protein